MEFLTTFRAEPKMKDVAVIMLTSVADQKSVVLALDKGVTSYITKPASAETIIKKLEQVNDWVRAQHERRA